MNNTEIQKWKEKIKAINVRKVVHIMPHLRCGSACVYASNPLNKTNANAVIHRRRRKQCCAGQSWKCSFLGLIHLEFATDSGLRILNYNHLAEYDSCVYRKLLFDVLDISVSRCSRFDLQLSLLIIHKRIESQTVSRENLIHSPSNNLPMLFFSCNWIVRVMLKLKSPRYPSRI